MLKRVLLFATVVLISGLLVGADTTQAQTAQEATWHAAYWDNRALYGPPVLEQAETDIDYAWGYDSPHPALPEDNFSARWSTDVYFPAGTYRFTAISDDGVRVWVDGDPVIDGWYDHVQETFTANKSLGEGLHHIVVEYYERERVAAIQFWWAVAPTLELQDWEGEYYNNAGLHGQPVLVRSDLAIEFNWQDGSPAPNINPDRFSVRWKRTVDLPAGSYRFEMTVDDGARLWVNGRLLIDAWEVQLPQTYTAEMYLPGGPTPIRMEYFDSLGHAVARLTWRQVPARTSAWQGTYFRGRAFAGAPVMARDDPQISFNWGKGSPAPDKLGTDEFSVRWIRTLNLEPGTYRFTMTVDDGGRLWINDRLLIDAWRVQSARTYTGLIQQSIPGPVQVSMEYFENTGLALAQLTWEKIE